MKNWFLIFLLVSTQAFAHLDEVFPFAAGTKLSRTRFRTVIQILKTKFSPLSQRDGRVLEFYTDYESDWAQGFARRWETDQVHIYGGLAAIPNVTEDSFALVVCHELGHLYGGVPYSDSHNRIAVEGQADYWATLRCFKEVVVELPKLVPSKNALELCHDEEVCARALDAALVLTAFYADNRSIPHPKLNTPDTTVVTEVLKTHPEPQCRLDTYKAGVFGSKPPTCWMPWNI
ncbi:hypothetical protein ACJVC5_14595 [Peredibacter sp. HCB2-198]|uniref:hypothetical protein n=1 Tax=Peredibacter sp. HCB2-198 TaxID=3383025 RepID=UPI0038B43533